MIARGRGDTTRFKRRRQETVERNAVDVLRETFREKKLARRPGLAPCAEAPSVYLGYDAASWFEPVLGRAGHQSDSDDAAWMFFRTVLAFDRVQQQMKSFRGIRR